MELPMNYYKDAHLEVSIIREQDPDIFDIISEQYIYVFQDIAF